MAAIQKYSKKREAILKVISTTDCHPSAEWIYSKVKAIYPDISLGTVYRNLSQFEQNGDIITVATVDGQKRYDFTTQPHTHFICEGCNGVIDIESEPSLEELYSRLKRDYSLSVSSHNLTFYGRCKNCQHRH